MADSGNKKVIIPLSNLKFSARQSGSTNIAEVAARFRVITEDKNSYSEWSPMYRIIPLSINQLLDKDSDGILEEVRTSYSASSTVATIIWERPPSLKDITSYDVYVKYGAGDYSYLKTVLDGRFDVIKPAGETATTASFLLQLSTNPKLVVSSLKVFELVDKTF